MTCADCGGPLGGDAALGIHPRCLSERLPYDAATALIGVAALFLVPFVRVWSAS
jgi:hypothetical protein